MRPFSSLVSLEEAKKIMLDNVKSISETETVAIEEAVQRVLAEDIKANLNVPPFDRSAMDGFAVKAEDTYGAGQFSPRPLEIVGKVRAGEQSQVGVENDQAVEIATGAPLPHGADAVVIVERTEVEGNAVKVFDPVHPQQNVSPAGSDIEKGAICLRKGELIHQGKIGVIAALGIEEVPVFRRPDVAIFPTGNEVCELGKSPSPSQVYDVNSYTIQSVARKNGCKAARYPVVEDTIQAIGSALEKAKGSDCIVFSGGSSVGERDVLVDVVREKGEVLFHGVQIKPGKPTLCGKVDGKLVFGLPGYPAACLTIGNVLMAPAFRKMASLPKSRIDVARFPLSKRVVSTLGRHQFLTVKIENGLAVPVFKESGAITSLGDAEGYIEIPSNVDFLEKEEIVEVRFF